MLKIKQEVTPTLAELIKFEYIKPIKQNIFDLVFCLIYLRVTD
jgi:hypothetical protein